MANNGLIVGRSRVMYYEEMIINGVLCYRNRPDSEWVEMSIEGITEKLDNAKLELAELKASLPKVRADAVDYAIDEADWFNNRETASISDMREIARQMEQGQ